MIQGFGGFLLLLDGGCCCACGAGCRAGGGPRFRYVLFCLQIMMKIKILNSIKTKIPKSSVESVSDVELPTSLKVKPLFKPKTSLNFFVNIAKTKTKVSFSAKVKTKVSTLSLSPG